MRAKRLRFWLLRNLAHAFQVLADKASQQLPPAERPEASGPVADSAAGSPPAHWLAKVRSAGPPADWLERVQRARASQGELGAAPTPRVEPAPARPMTPAEPEQVELAPAQPAKRILLVGPMPRPRERRAARAGPAGPAAPLRQSPDDRVEPAQEPRRQTTSMAETEPRRPARPTRPAVPEVKAESAASAATSPFERPPGEKPQRPSSVPEQKSVVGKGAVKELPPPQNSARPVPAKQPDWGEAHPAPAADRKKDIEPVVAYAAPPEIEEEQRRQPATRDAWPVQGAEPVEEAFVSLSAPGVRQWATPPAVWASPEIEVAWVKSPQPEQAWSGHAPAQNEPAPRIENQWPALLDDTPDALDEWEVALRAWEHLKRLDQEQQG